MSESLTDAELAEIDRWHIDRFHQRAEVRDLGRPCRVCPLLAEVQRLRAREQALAAVVRDVVAAGHTCWRQYLPPDSDAHCKCEYKFAVEALTVGAP